MNPKFCPNCGAPLQGEGKFCMQCGSPVPPAPAAQPEWKPDATQKWNPEVTQQWDMDATQKWDPGNAEQWTPNSPEPWNPAATQQLWEQIPEAPIPERPAPVWESAEPEWEEPAAPPVWNTTVAKTTIAEQKAAGKPPKDKKLIALIISICSLVVALALLVGVILLQSCDSDTDDRDDRKYSDSREDADTEEETEETDETEETEETEQTEETEETEETTLPPTEETLPPINLEDLVNQRELTFRTEGGIWHLCIAEDGDLSQIQWTTSDPTVATVDETGTVTAVGKGTAAITATYEDQAVVCVVTVEGGMSYAEYVAAEFDTEVTVDCYVQATQEWFAGTISIYAQDQDGGYFIYNAICTQEEAARLTAGTKIRVTGYKTKFDGLVEIMDATVEILDEAKTWIAEPLDVTAMTDAELENHMNKRVVFTGVTVEKIEYKNGQPGDDIYITVNDNGMTRAFCVEIYLTGTDSDVYQTVSTLTEGSVVDIAGFLYWYEGPNPHITAITVK